MSFENWDGLGLFKNLPDPRAARSREIRQACRLPVKHSPLPEGAGPSGWLFRWQRGVVKQWRADHGCREMSRFRSQMFKMCFLSIFIFIVMTQRMSVLELAPIALFCSSLQEKMSRRRRVKKLRNLSILFVFCCPKSRAAGKVWATYVGGRAEAANDRAPPRHTLFQFLVLSLEHPSFLFVWWANHFLLVTWRTHSPGTHNRACFGGLSFFFSFFAQGIKFQPSGPGKAKSAPGFALVAIWWWRDPFGGKGEMCVRVPPKSKCWWNI